MAGPRLTGLDAARRFEKSLGRLFAEYARPRQRMGLRAWAEANVWLQHGDKVIRYRGDTQPVSRLFLDLWDTGDYSYAYCSGPSQSGKTTTFYEIPALYGACELAENAVHGIPLDEMVNDKFGSLFAAMRRSHRLRRLLPPTHRDGSGGKIKDKQTLTNGAELRPMTINGSDAARAGYPARLVYVTELKEFSGQVSTSVEANTLRQIFARMRSFPRDTRRFIGEGTFGTKDQLPYSAKGADDDDVLRSTQTRLLCPCPHCGEGVSPGRENLHGWQDAQSELEAAERAYYACPACGGRINDEQRRAMVRQVVAVHAGQRFDREAGVVGDHPPTRSLYYAYEAFHNLLLSQGDVAVDEFSAAQEEEGTEASENAERELCQFVHGTTFESKLAKNDPLDAKALRQRLTTWDRNVLPPDTLKVTAGVDIGKWKGWWVLIAHRANGARVVVGYGSFEIAKAKNDRLGERIHAALDLLADETIEPGLVQEGAAERRPVDEVWIDGNYRSDDVAGWIRTRGGVRTNRYRFCRGAGKSARNQFNNARASYSNPRATTRTITHIGEQFYREINHARRVLDFTFNADYWKLQLDEALKAPIGAPGSLSLCRASFPKEHHTLTTHLANEQVEMEFKAGVGVVSKFVRRGDQHLKDGAAMALVAGASVGYQPDPEAVAATQAEMELAAASAGGEPTPIDWSNLR